MTSSFVDYTLERALAYVAEFKGDGRCSLNCLYSEKLAAEVHRLRDERADLLAALKAAHMFIQNGIALGYIRMPDPTIGDPASRTPDLVRTAIDRAEAKR